MNRSLRNHLNHILPIFNGDILYHFLILKILFPTHFFSNIFNIYSVVHFEMHQKESKESFLHNDKTYQRFFVPLQRNSISNTTHHLQKIHNFSEIFSLFKIFHITFVLVCLIMFCVKCCMLWSFNKKKTLCTERENSFYSRTHRVLQSQYRAGCHNVTMPLI